MTLRHFRPLPFPDRILTKALLREGEMASRAQAGHLLTELARVPREERRRVIRLLPLLAVRALAEE